MAIVISLVTFILFLFFQATGIVSGDSGDLVTAAATFGVPHPPGYPLYTLLGWLLHHIPISTPAWRVGLLSSVSHAAVIYVVCTLVYAHTKNRLASVVSSLFLVGNYIFFLYSVTPEVFALLDVGVVVLLYCIHAWINTHKHIYLFVIAICLGLSVAHHHMIACMFPALFYVIWSGRKYVKKTITIKNIIYMIVAFALGLLPYAYVYFASRGGSIINWDNATTIPNFIRLITRADYGTFQSGAMVGQLISQRLLQVKAFIQYFYLDFHLLGSALCVIGFMWLWKTQRTIAKTYLLAFGFMGPIFLFYASFPLMNSFTLATIERFLLPSYVIASIVIGVGFDAVWRYIYTKIPRYLFLWVIVCFMVVSIYGASTLWKFQGLAGDRTAELFAEDYFINLPKGSMLVVGNDTTIFTTQYIRYALGFRPDTIVVQGGMLTRAEYRSLIQKKFPSFRDSSIHTNVSISDILVANASYTPVYSNVQYPLPPQWKWVPHGLVFQLVEDHDLLSDDIVIARNDDIWAKIHNPMDGILSRYNHLMLSDIRDVHADVRVSYGKILLKAKKERKAEEYLKKAVDVVNTINSAQSYMYLGLSQLFQNKCNEALQSFDQSERASHIKDSSISLYQAITYRDCFDDDAKAKIFFDEYAKRKAQEETPLDQAL